MNTMASVRSLLLNASYEPMKIVSWQKALILWFQNKVDVLEYHTTFARTVQLKFQLPSVLKLKAYVRPKNFHVVRFCRENVYIRDNFTCQYCGVKFPTKHLTLDHVVPASHNGPKKLDKCDHRLQRLQPEKSKQNSPNCKHAPFKRPTNSLLAAHPRTSAQ